MNNSPRCFISYSWDSDLHKNWVKELASRLRHDGVTVILDCWHAVPGDQLPEFMEREIRQSDFVLIICSPKYKDRSDQRKGGVGYEGDIITGEIFVRKQLRKFIPVLKSDSWINSAPSFLIGTYYVDLSESPYSENHYKDLLATLLGNREEAPPVGAPPTFGEQKDTFVLLKRNYTGRRRHRPFFGFFLFEDEWRYDISFSVYIDSIYVGEIANNGELYIETTLGKHLLRAYARRDGWVDTGEGGGYDTCIIVEVEETIEVKKGKNILYFNYAEGHVEDHISKGTKPIFFS